MTLNYWDMCNSILRCALCIRIKIERQLQFPTGKNKVLFFSFFLFFSFNNNNNKRNATLIAKTKLRAAALQSLVKISLTSASTFPWKLGPNSKQHGERGHLYIKQSYHTNRNHDFFSAVAQRCEPFCPTHVCGWVCAYVRACACVWGGEGHSS